MYSTQHPHHDLFRTCMIALMLLVCDVVKAASYEQLPPPAPFAEQGIDASSTASSKAVMKAGSLSASDKIKAYKETQGVFKEALDRVKVALDCKDDAKCYGKKVNNLKLTLAQRKLSAVEERRRFLERDIVQRPHLAAAIGLGQPLDLDPAQESSAAVRRPRMTSPGRRRSWPRRIPTT